MENKTSKRIKLLIGAVLVLFLAMLVVDFVPAGIAGFKEGWEAGEAEANGEPGGGSRYFVKIEALDPDEAVHRFDGGEELAMVAARGELLLSGVRVPVWIKVVRTLLVLVAFAALVVFLVQLVVFAVKFPRRKMMARENMVSMRRIAVSLGVFGLSAYAGEVTEYLWLRERVALEGYRLGLDPLPSALIVALILWAMTEILNLAGRLQNEQDLTI